MSGYKTLISATIVAAATQITACGGGGGSEESVIGSPDQENLPIVSQETVAESSKQAPTPSAIQQPSQKTETSNAPQILLFGAAIIELTIGENYPEPGYIASDKQDGDLTKEVRINASQLDIYTPGAYQITYKVKDSTGLESALAFRTVVIQDPENTKTVEEHQSSLEEIDAGVIPPQIGLMPLSIAHFNSANILQSQTNINENASIDIDGLRGLTTSLSISASVLNDNNVEES